MIWELSQDAVGANSLLKVIDDEINQSSGNSSSLASVASSVAASSIAPAASSMAVSSVPATPDNKSSGGSGSLGLFEMLLLALLMISLKFFMLSREEKDF
jgi:hypothetical protein